MGVTSLMTDKMVPVLERAILYPALSFLLSYTPSLSTPILQDFCKFRNSKKMYLTIVLIIVNINKDENKSLISNQFSLRNDLWTFLTF